MREMLYSEIANYHGIPNIPDEPNLAIAAGTRLCEELLEPLHATFGHVTVRSAFRSVEVNTYGHERIDKGVRVRRDDVELLPPRVGPARRGRVHGGDGQHRHPLVPPALRGGNAVAGARLVDTRPLALFGHDVLWREGKELQRSTCGGTRSRSAASTPFPRARVLLTKPGMANHGGDHSAEYPSFPEIGRH